MQKVALIASVLLVAVLPNPSLQQTPLLRHAVNPLPPDNYQYVYQVVSSGNPRLKNSVVQTGFKMRGLKGIITSLHGVVGATSIRAGNYDKLEVHSVDIKNDLALLSSPLLEREIDTGLPKSWFTYELVKTGETLRVYGHPGGISTHEKKAIVDNPPFKQLSQFVPVNLAEAFETRQSPDEGIRVMNLDVSLLPGASGAPVINSNGLVVGIVGGGLIGGAISWAIPIQNINWIPASEERGAIRRLARLDPAGLFALEVKSSTSGTETKDVYTFQLAGIINGRSIAPAEFNETHRVIAVLQKVPTFNLTIKQLKNGRLCNIANIVSPNQNNRPGENKTNSQQGEARAYFLAGLQFMPMTKRTFSMDLFLNPGWKCTL